MHINTKLRINAFTAASLDTADRTSTIYKHTYLSTISVNSRLIEFNYIILRDFLLSGIELASPENQGEITAHFSTDILSRIHVIKHKPSISGGRIEKEQRDTKSQRRNANIRT